MGYDQIFMLYGSFGIFMEYKLETRGEAGRTSFLNVQMKEDVGVNQQAVKNRQKQGISETPWETSLRKGD